MHASRCDPDVWKAGWRYGQTVALAARRRRTDRGFVTHLSQCEARLVDRGSREKNVRSFGTHSQKSPNPLPQACREEPHAIAGHRLMSPRTPRHGFHDAGVARVRTQGRYRRHVLAWQYVTSPRA